MFHIDSAGPGFELLRSFLSWLCFDRAPLHYLGERLKVRFLGTGAADWNGRDVRLLYATDTAGIPAVASHLAGLELYGKFKKPITALIMEATIGLGHDDDFRVFTHSSVSMVAHAVRVLTKIGRYRPRKGQSVWLTHMARTLHGTQAELDKALPKPLKAAYDGLEIEL